MTGVEFFATIGLPVLLVLASYLSVVAYEWTSRRDSGNASRSGDKPDAEPA
jgi:hypothetical protein